MAADEQDDERLGFFNQLWGRLNLELSEPPQPISERLLNEAAPPSARIGRVSLELRVVVDIEDNAYRDLTEEEWRRMVLPVPVIRLRGLGEIVVRHRAPDGASFTVRDVVVAIVETERQTRASTEWFGGIDVHHVYLSGTRRQRGVVDRVGFVADHGPRPS
jgi:hypothetical protein